MTKEQEIEASWAATKRPSVPLTVGRGVDVYAMGIIHCSICVPGGIPIGVAIELVNAEYPTGIDSVWQLAKDKTFASGEPNPCSCDQAGSDRKHYLLCC